MTKNFLENNFFQSDLVSRTFIKQRGTAEIEYKFTTRSDIFSFFTKYKDVAHNDIVLSCLMEYLIKIFKYGYEEKSLGCSDTIEVVGVVVSDVKDPMLQFLASQSGYLGMGNRQHFICQDHLLKRDPSFICYELPVWDDERSGFIDLIRYKDGYIYIMDFKPNAKKEKVSKVLSQLMRYKSLLQHQLGIPPERIICQFFDAENVYQLNHI